MAIKVELFDKNGNPIGDSTLDGDSKGDVISHNLDQLTGQAIDRIGTDTSFSTVHIKPFHPSTEKVSGKGIINEQRVTLIDPVDHVTIITPRIRVRISHDSNLRN